MFQTTFETIILLIFQRPVHGARSDQGQDRRAAPKGAGQQAQPDQVDRGGADDGQRLVRRPLVWRRPAGRPHQGGDWARAVLAHEVHLPGGGVQGDQFLIYLIFNIPLKHKNPYVDIIVQNFAKSVLPVLQTVRAREDPLMAPQDALTNGPNNNQNMQPGVAGPDGKTLLNKSSSGTMAAGYSRYDQERFRKEGSIDKLYYCIYIVYNISVFPTRNRGVPDQHDGHLPGHHAEVDHGGRQAQAAECRAQRQRQQRRRQRRSTCDQQGQNGPKERCFGRIALDHNGERQAA